MAGRDDVVNRYLDYLDACNRRAWDDLGRFLADTVLVNGRAQTRREYVENVKATTAVFPDYRWELRRAVVEGDWLAVHLHDEGTRAPPFLGSPGDGAGVETDEFTINRACARQLVYRTSIWAL